MKFLNAVRHRPTREGKRAHSLVIDTSLTIFLVGVALSIFFATCSLFFVRSHEGERQIAHVADLLSTVESTVRIACFVGDKALADEIARGLMSNRAVAGVRISAGDQVLTHMGVAAGADPLNPVVRRQVASPFDAGDNVGDVEVVANGAFIEAQESSYAWMAVVILLAEALSVAFLVGAVVLRTIVKPIKEFSDDLHQGRRLVPHKSNEGNEIGVLADDVNAMIDRLERMLEQEQAMRAEVARSESRLRNLVDNSPDMIVRYDLDCRRVFVNPAFARLTRIPIDVARDSRVDDMAIWRPTMDVEEYLSRLRAVMQSGLSDQMLIEWIDDSGICVSHEILLVPERDGHGVIVGALAIGRNVTERKAFEMQLLHQATHDALTGLPNRALLKDRVEHSLARAQREESQLALVFVDLDNFKSINDTLGHDVGDELLKIVASRMRGALREEDTVARFGGDEFVVTLEGVISPQDLDGLVRKIFQAVAAPCVVSDQQLYPAASLGVALFPQDGVSFDVLMRHADTAMYAAKAQGRNCYRFFSAEMNLHLSEWMSLGNSLRLALERGEFELYYQPKASTSAEQLTGVEALIRWRHPERGLISPAQFIPLAEESGLIILLGEWVLREACRQHQAWLKQGLPPVKVAVNLSPLQCKSEGLVQRVQEVLEQFGMNGNWLELEVTESVAMSEVAIEALWTLRQQGVQIAMDDFGTGYSSLSNVKRLPIHCLKIDRSFVSDIERNPRDVQIVTAIIAMAHSLGLQVCAEGVETVEQLEILRSLGCDEIQGYLLSRPVPADAAAAFMERGAVEAILSRSDAFSFAQRG